MQRDQRDLHDQIIGKLFQLSLQGMHIEIGRHAQLGLRVKQRLAGHRRRGALRRQLFHVHLLQSQRARSSDLSAGTEHLKMV